MDKDITKGYKVRNNQKSKEDGRKRVKLFFLRDFDSRHRRRSIAMKYRHDPNFSLRFFCIGNTAYIYSAMFQKNTSPPPPQYIIFHNKNNLFDW